MNFNDFVEHSNIVVFKCFDKTHNNIIQLIEKYHYKSYVFNHCIDYMYKNYPLNTNHFQTSYHISTILPKISEILNIPYSQNDFNKIIYKQNNFDLTYLYPIKDNDSYEIITDNIHEKGNYSILQNVNKHDPKCPSNYHSLFRGYHKNTRIFNYDAVTDKKLLICCDSEMIPDIPVLSYYFKEIIHLDNRGSKYSLKNWTTTLDEYECLLAMLNSNGLYQYKVSIEK